MTPNIFIDSWPPGPNQNFQEHLHLPQVTSKWAIMEVSQEFRHHILTFAGSTLTSLTETTCPKKINSVWKKDDKKKEDDGSMKP